MNRSGERKREKRKGIEVGREREKENGGKKERKMRK